MQKTLGSLISLILGLTHKLDEVARSICSSSAEFEANHAAMLKAIKIFRSDMLRYRVPGLAKEPRGLSSVKVEIY